MLRKTGNLLSFLHVKMRTVKGPCALFFNTKKVCTKKMEQVATFVEICFELIGFKKFLLNTLHVEYVFTL